MGLIFHVVDHEDIAAFPKGSMSLEFDGMRTTCLGERDVQVDTNKDILSCQINLLSQTY